MKNKFFKIIILFCISIFVFLNLSLTTNALNIHIVDSLRRSENIEDFKSKVRISIMNDLMKNWFNNFITVPYPWKNSNYIFKPVNNFSWFELSNWNISERDNLDTIINNLTPVSEFYFKILTKIKNNPKISPNKINRYRELLLFHVFKNFSDINIDTKNLWKIYLFRSKKDLDRLWYKITSSRERKNIDTKYRRQNISDAFKNIWNVRILNSKENFSYNKEIKLNSYNYKMWQAILAGWKIWYVKWWWLCWGSTAIYQWMITNWDIEFTSKKNHSKWWGSLYNAYIDWEHLAIPW